MMRQISGLPHFFTPKTLEIGGIIPLSILEKHPFESIFSALSPCESVLFLYFLSTHLSTQVSTQPHFQIKTGLESAGYQMGFKGW